eukprot:TRINITY_DN79128_c0_g1_i1.p1 TRINITY_DN79128_c0_g1~~TRINITY_DN79128_c0_g1_i1.p1  ORF type:complete len:385 (+),score=60.61 TRINITY_DN79128_c0_g1_i1:90-1244(+)
MTGFYDDRVVGYLAVPFVDSEEILKFGYICSAEAGSRVNPPGATKCHTSRDKVPFSKDRTDAVKAMRKYRKSEKFSALLEIRKVAADGDVMPYEIREGDGKIILGPDRKLDAKFLSDGTFLVRGAGDYAGVGCPLCNKAIDGVTCEPGCEGMPAVRGKVGMAIYVGDAFMVSPCPTTACIEAQQERQDRLDGGPRYTLYHACSRATADKIKSCGGKFLRGAGGAGGGGIYFAHTVRETWWKAEDGTLFGSGSGAPKMWLKAKGRSGWTEQDYVFFEVEVKMGKIYEGTRHEKNVTFRDLVHKDGGPYDSCILDRAQTGYPVPAAPVCAATADGTMLSTREEDVASGKASNLHGGYEFIVYSWDQVRIIRELPFAEIDPPPSALP